MHVEEGGFEDERQSAYHAGMITCTHMGMPSGESLLSKARGIVIEHTLESRQNEKEKGYGETELNSERPCTGMELDNRKRETPKRGTVIEVIKAKGSLPGEDNSSQMTMSTLSVHDSSTHGLGAAAARPPPPLPAHR